MLPVQIKSEIYTAFSAQYAQETQDHRHTEHVSLRFADILNRIVRSREFPYYERVITYVIETRAETIIKRLLRTTETRILRCITGNALWDRIRNKDVRNSAKFKIWIRKMGQNQETNMEKSCKLDESSTGLQKLLNMGNQILSDRLDGL